LYESAVKYQPTNQPIIDVAILLKTSTTKPVYVFVFTRIVKDVRTDSKEGREALQLSVASDSSDQKTASTASV